VDTPLTPAARNLLGRLIRSGPWQVAGLPPADGPDMLALESLGLVERVGGAFRPTAAGRADRSAYVLPS
jgi:hypothetical protein